LQRFFFDDFLFLIKIDFGSSFVIFYFYFLFSIPVSIAINFISGTCFFAQLTRQNIKQFYHKIALWSILYPLTTYKKNVVRKLLFLNLCYHPLVKKLFLIDGNAIIHRAYHALPRFTTKKGELVNAIYGFASMLLNILNNQKPDYIAVSFDRKAKTFRHEEYKDYKATRVKAPDELYEQIPRIKQIVEAFNIPIYEMDGYEADDILGTLAKQAEKVCPTEPAANELEPIHTFIVTGDMDTLQLVNDKTFVFAPHKGFNDTLIYDTAKVMAKYGLLPSQIVDYKALRGDTSDNIPGVHGIGEKGAAELLKKYSTLDGIYEHLNSLHGALHDKLEKGKEDAYFSKRLATLILDVPIKLDINACKTHEFDLARITALFEELEFKSLLKKLGTFNSYCSDRRNEECASQQSLF
jgi:DNA polymerase-1